MKLPLIVKKNGLFCPSGEFYIDAWAPVPLCIVTHAHGDHAYPGHNLYISSQENLPLLNHRLGNQISVHTYPYNQKFKLKNCWISLHPAGHIYGSSQIRIETEHEVCVVSGDYKRASDPTCKPFEIVECDTFVTESTFALPIYQWESSEISIRKIYEWWMENRARGFNSVLFCYALGKAQRVMAMLSKLSQGPIYLHGAVLSIAEIYLKQGVSLIPFLPATSQEKTLFRGDLILAPPSAKGTSWLKRFYPYKSGFVSGWMQVRGARKQRNVDTGFVLSDHADWPDLLKTIKETKATQIVTTHGNSVILSRYLNDIGLSSQPLQGTELLEKEES